VQAALDRLAVGEIAWPEMVTVRRNGRFFDVVSDTGTL
jgi:hypothetical protein